MGYAAQLTDLTFHLTVFYLWSYNVYYFCAAEIIWTLLKALTHSRRHHAVSRLSYFSAPNEDLKKKLLHEQPNLANLHAPDFERAEWINDILGQIWTPVNRALQKILAGVVTDLINIELRKTLKVSFSFVTVDIGTVPFQIGGIKSHCGSSAREEICLDIDIIYNGDAAFVVKVGIVKAGIRDVKLRGTLRVLLRPLLTEPPIVAGGRFYFIRQPIISYSFTNQLNFLNFESIAGPLDVAFHGILGRVAVAPNAVEVDFVGDKWHYNADSDLPRGVVRVHLVEADHLKAATLHGTSSPYVLFTFGLEQRRSETVVNNLFPHWDTFYQFAVHYEDESLQLEYRVLDDDPHASVHHVIGQGLIDINRIRANGFMEELCHLDKTGVLHLKFEWLNLSDQYSDLKQQIEICEKMQRISHSTIPVAKLYITVHSATRLQKTGNELDLSTKVVVTLGDEHAETIALESTNSPIWNQILHLYIFNMPKYVVKFDIVSVYGSLSHTVFTHSYNLEDLFKESHMRCEKRVPLIPHDSKSFFSFSLLCRTFRPNEKYLVPEERPEKTHSRLAKNKPDHQEHGPRHRH